MAILYSEQKAVATLIRGTALRFAPKLKSKIITNFKFDSDYRYSRTIHLSGIKNTQTIFRESKISNLLGILKHEHLCKMVPHVSNREILWIPCLLFYILCFRRI